jgi:hypothetical protein
MEWKLLKIRDVLPPLGSVEAERTEVIHLHCTPEERTLIERKAKLRAGGNVNAYILGLVKFGRSSAEKNS